MENIKNEITYQVIDDIDYKLTIVFGNAQKGSSAFRKVNGTFVTGAVKNESLGKGSQIRNTELMIGSIVADVNPHTNETIITYNINGVDIATFRNDVGTPNSSIFYTTTIKFI